MQGKDEYKFQASHATIQFASAESETTERSQNQKRKMTSNDTKLNIPINSLKIYIVVAFYKTTLFCWLSYLYYFVQVFLKSLLFSPYQLHLLTLQTAHLHQYLVEDLQQTLSEKNAQFVLHSDELNSR